MWSCKLSFCIFMDEKRGTKIIEQEQGKTVCLTLRLIQARKTLVMSRFIASGYESFFVTIQRNFHAVQY